jgi:hypothetical protein
MKIETRKVTISGTATAFLVIVNGETAGLVTRMKSSRSSITPFTAYAWDGSHVQTGAPCAGSLLGHFYTDADVQRIGATFDGIPGGRAEAIAACVDRFASALTV